MDGKSGFPLNLLFPVSSVLRMRIAERGAEILQQSRIFRFLSGGKTASCRRFCRGLREAAERKIEFGDLPAAGNGFAER